MMKITFLGNHSVDYSSETHHCKTLEAMGHEVIRLQEGSARGEDVLEHGMASDMLIVVHTHGWQTPGIPLHQVLDTINRTGRPTATFHLDLWFGLQRQRDLDRDPFYRSIGWFFTVDRLMADWFCQNTDVRGRYLPAGVFGPECYISVEPSNHANDVVFVGSRRYHPEHPWRPKLIDWLRETYGSRFTHVGGDGDTGTLRGDDLNRMYANSKVAVGDTLCMNFDYPDYHSDRLFECPGRGGFQLFPRIRGLDRFYTDGEHLRWFDFGDFDGLKTLIDYYLTHDDEREAIRRAGHEHTKANHTYQQRWQSILKAVFPHG